MIYTTYMFPEPSIASREEWDMALITLYISVVGLPEGNGN